MPSDGRRGQQRGGAPSPSSSGRLPSAFESIHSTRPRQTATLILKERGIVGRGFPVMSPMLSSRHGLQTTLWQIVEAFLAVCLVLIFWKSSNQEKVFTTQVQIPTTTTMMVSKVSSLWKFSVSTVCQRYDRARVQRTS